MQEYLTRLAAGIGERPGNGTKSVNRRVAKTAREALAFLRARDEFWHQVDIGRKAKPQVAARMSVQKEAR